MSFFFHRSNEGAPMLFKVCELKRIAVLNNLNKIVSILSEKKKKGLNQVVLARGGQDIFQSLIHHGSSTTMISTE